MLSTVALVVAGLSTANKIGLATVGFLFVAFALVSALVLPRRNPDFPGKRLGWYVALCVLFFIAMISAVLYFDREPSKASGAACDDDRRAHDDGSCIHDHRHDHGAGDDRAGDDRAGRRGRCDGGQGGLRLGGLRRLPHAEGGGLDRDGRAEPRSAEAAARPDRAAGRQRRRADAGLQGPADRQADPGRRRVRLRVDALLGKTPPERTKPARGRGGNRRSYVNRRW